MPSSARRASVKAFAKLNLCLEVLGRRPDGYHDIRTIFQTISLADGIDIEFTPGRKTAATLDSSIDIPDNLVLRAARAVMEATNAKGVAQFRLNKRIPMGGGLGGGSSDAAAVLLALPALTGRPLSWERLLDIGTGLGSDVPFFLMGGTAIGLGRGTELYPIAEPKAVYGLLVTPSVHVATREAYRALSRPLTSEQLSPKINVSQRISFSLTEGITAGEWSGLCSNDFESVVFRQYPELGAIKRRLNRLGARPALMTGSGSALFGVFSGPDSLESAMAAFDQPVFRFSFLSRSRYYESWWKQLAAHIQGRQWPPLSRHSR